MEDITDADYEQAKRLCKGFEIKNLGEYHDLYVQNALLLADVFENFWNVYCEIYNIDVLLMVEKGIRGGMCHCMYWYGKANNRYMKDYDKDKELSCLKM